MEKLQTITTDIARKLGDAVLCLGDMIDNAMDVWGEEGDDTRA